MFCMKERALYCRYGPCQFNGSSTQMICLGDSQRKFWKQSCGPPVSAKLKDVGVRNYQRLADQTQAFDNCCEQQRVRERKPSGGLLKTPPLSPTDSPTSPKKNVRFADALGLELEAVRLFEKSDVDYQLNLPESFVKSVYRSRRFLANINAVNRLPVEKILEPCFEQHSDILKQVHERKVCLEKFTVTNLSFKATVRVENIATEKTVKARFTINDWTTYYDLPARHTEHCGLTDKFTFEISLPKDFLIGCRVEFAVCYEVGDQVFWDNNDEENYAFECSNNHHTTKL
ncbi:protein phosphatase 1 regulatory subunit 3C-like [Saccoglossus kowalevskii]